MPCRPRKYPSGQARFVLPGPNLGLIKPGNIDLFRRPFARNSKPGSSGSTVASASWDLEPGDLEKLHLTRFVDGMAILVSTVLPLTPVTALGFTGRLVSSRKALDVALAQNRHLGIFTNWHTADRYSDRLHLQQQRIYSC